MHKKQITRINRRDFLKASTAFGVFTILPGYRSLGQQSPNERLRLAAIGIGNQGAANINSLMKSGLADMVALCDVDLQGKHCAKPLEKYSKAATFTDFRKMFDQMADQIDAVLIATPDHSHFCASMLAMSLGKPIYVQKPLAHTFGQCQRLIDMAERSGVVTQMGNQGHSGANYFQFKAWTEAGIIKDVTRITAHMNNSRRWHGWGSSVTEYPSAPLPEGLDWDQWVDQAPVHPYSKKLHPQEWRSWFDYGCGAFGDWGPHILDTCHRFLKLGLPEKIVPVMLDGTNDLVFPQASTIEFRFPARDGMPPCVVTWYDGRENYPEVEKELGHEEVNKETGEKVFKAVNVSKPGKIIYSKELVFQGGSHSSPLQILPRDKFMDMRESLPRVGGKNSDHFKNFLLACKGEEEARSPFAVSGPLTQIFNLGIISQRLKQELNFDPKTKKITNNPQAQALMDPPPRIGWEEFYQL